MAPHAAAGHATAGQGCTTVVTATSNLHRRTSAAVAAKASVTVRIARLGEGHRRIEALRNQFGLVHCDSMVGQYCRALVIALRNERLHRPVLSTRAATALLQGCCCAATLKNQDFVTPAHVAVIAPYVLLHRLIECDGFTEDDAIEAVHHALRSTPKPA